MPRSSMRRLNQRMKDSNVNGAGPMIVTCWYRDVGEGLKFNHISNGYHEAHTEPPYLFESQRLAWDGGEWIGKEATIENGRVSELP